MEEEDKVLNDIQFSPKYWLHQYGNVIIPIDVYNVNLLMKPIFPWTYIVVPKSLAFVLIFFS